MRAARFLRLGAVVVLGIAGFVVSAPSHATPLACTGSCEVTASTNTGYQLPVIEIASGADVHWVTSTTSHPTAENTVVDQASPCFQVAVGPGNTPVPVVFTASATGVTATESGITNTCSAAHALSDAAWAVPYHCQLHPWMNGVIVVDR